MWRWRALTTHELQMRQWKLKTLSKGALQICTSVWRDGKLTYGNSFLNWDPLVLTEHSTYLFQLCKEVEPYLHDSDCQVLHCMHDFSWIAQLEYLTNIFRASWMSWTLPWRKKLSLYEGYSESNLRLFLATNVGAGESSEFEVASHDSLSYKRSHNWSPIVCSCLLLSDLWRVLRFIIPPAAVYGQNVMSEGTVRQWCRMFKDGRTNVHDEERSGRPSAVSDWLVQSVNQKICERRRFTISELSCGFPHISRTVLYKIITDRLGYHKFCARWVQHKVIMSWWKASKRGWAQWRQTSFTQAYKNLFPDTSASIHAVTMLRNSLSM
jgi:hypothetical protein